MSCWAPLTAGFASEPADKAYFSLIYDFEVAGYCGLITPQVLDATKSKRAAMEEQSPLSAEELRKIRIAAFLAADREYQNRSLGGHRAWCSGEGQAGVNRLLDTPSSE